MLIEFEISKELELYMLQDYPEIIHIKVHIHVHMVI